MKRFVTIAVLTAALCAQTLAGEIPSGGAPAPPPNGITQTPPAPGDMPSGGVAEQISSDVLSGLLSVLGFLAV